MNFKEMKTITDAVSLCENIDFSINGNERNPQEYFPEIYRQAVSTETEKGTPVAEILEILGDTVKETVDLWLGSQENKAVYGNVSFSYVADTDKGLSCTMKCLDREYSVTEDFSVKDAVMVAVHNSYSMSDKSAVMDAVYICKCVDEELNGEPATFYSEFAEAEMKKHTPAETIIRSLKDSVCESANLFIEVQTQNADTDYEKEVWKNSTLYGCIEEGCIKLKLDCCDRDYPVRNGDEIWDIINEEIEKAEELYKEEDDFDRED